MKKQVLIVDDEPEICQLLALFLEDDFNLTLCSDSREAIATLKVKPFDFVISDIRMPFADGYEVLSSALMAQPNIKVVLMTGHAQTPSDVADAKKLGAKEVLTKPFGNPAKIVELLHSLASN